MNGAPRPGGWVRPADVSRHSPAGQALLADIRLAEDQRRQRHLELLAKFRDTDRKIARIKDAEAELIREQAAAQVVVEPAPVHMESADPPGEGIVPPPDIDADIVLGSPEHRRLREQYGIGRQDRGVFGN